MLVLHHGWHLVIAENVGVKAHEGLFPVSREEMGWLRVSGLAGCSPLSLSSSDKGQPPFVVSWETPGFCAGVWCGGSVGSCPAGVPQQLVLFGRCLTCSGKSPTGT